MKLTCFTFLSFREHLNLPNRRILANLQSSNGIECLNIEFDLTKILWKKIRHPIHPGPKLAGPRTSWAGSSTRNQTNRGGRCPMAQWRGSNPATGVTEVRGSRPGR
jgi:hypothetical protein